ncbi:DUF2218 domain-containing protein [Methylobacterium sp. Leaf108]|uniref:DUF2218 domain-containing protein n=1 Tax=Methylobacterium sp. Leaf108 TaxID=1736256 RepID=UPI0006F5D35A|nr:DUF2218 domain-containing protein [Methylobacterium sp. Leaf108]KQP55251.1 2,4-dihydroxyhept-2-ene-1,7-dioic acid aldolase [Methylobacterium sp. Leaf108]
MLQSRAVVPTPHASRYLQQLCKHWAHRFETAFTDSDGRIALPLGETRLSASAEALTIDLTARDTSDLSGLRDVVARHVERFAFRETLRYDWTEAASGTRDAKEPSQ